MDSTALGLLRALSDAVAAVEDGLVGGADDAWKSSRPVDAVIAAGLAVGQLLDRGTAAPRYAVDVAAASIERLAPLAASAAESSHLLAARAFVRVVLRIASGDPHADWPPFGIAGRPALEAAIEDARGDLAQALQLSVRCADPKRSSPDVEGERLRLLAGGVSPELLPEDERAAARAHRETMRIAAGRLWGPGPIDPEAASTLDDESTPALVRGATALGIAARDLEAGRAPDPRAFTALVACVAPDERAWQDPWGPPGLFLELADPTAPAVLGPGAAALALRSPVGTARWEALVRVLVAALEAVPDARHQRAAMGSALLRLAMVERARPWPFADAGDLMTPSPAELDPRSRLALEAVAHHVSAFQWEYDVHHTLSELRLPKSRVGLRRWLGLDPPGILDLSLPVTKGDGTVATATIGRWCESVVSGVTPAAHVATALARALSPRLLVRFASDAFPNFDHRHLAPMLPGEGALAWTLVELRIAVLLEGARHARAEVVELVEERLELALERGPLCGDTRFDLLAYIRLREAEPDVLPDRYDQVVLRALTQSDEPVDLARRVLEALPRARRDRIIVEHARAAVQMGIDATDLLDAEGRALLEATPRQRLHPALEGLGESFNDLLEGLGGKLGS